MPRASRGHARQMSPGDTSLACQMKLGMLSFGLLFTAFFSVYCDSRCYFDMEGLRCWCRNNKNGVTIFRIEHSKDNHNTWIVEYRATDERCTSDDVINVLPPSWTNRKDEDEGDEEDGGDGIIVNDPCGTTYVLNDTEETKEMKGNGYIQIGHSLYKLHTTGISWDHARLTCMNEGAQLAIINSKFEAEFLALFFHNRSSIMETVENKDSVFIGFHDIFEEGEYLTIEGEPLADTGFNLWATNKPNNNGLLEVGHPGADCGGLFVNGTLTDLHCDAFYAFICEYELRVDRRSQIDYSNGAFIGKEGFEDPPQGTKKRTNPGIGYIYYAGFGFYRYHTTPLVWENAQLMCEREGAHLAIIDSDKEINLLKSIVNRVPRKFIRGAYEKFAVYTGRPKKTNGNIADEQRDAERCRSSESDGGVAGVYCQVKNVFICEKSLYEE